MMLATSIYHITTYMNNKQWLGVALMLFGSISLVLILFVAWSFKDGMGPDSVQSTGLEAVGKLFDVQLVSIYSIFLCLVVSGFLVYRNCG